MKGSNIFEADLHIIVPIEALIAHGATKLHRPYEDLSRRGNPKSFFTAPTDSLQSLHVLLFFFTVQRLCPSIKLS